MLNLITKLFTSPIGHCGCNSELSRLRKMRDKALTTEDVILPVAIGGNRGMLEATFADKARVQSPWHSH